MDKQLVISINDKGGRMPPSKDIGKEELQALIEGLPAYNTILEQMKLNYRLSLANFQAIGKETETYRSIQEIERIQGFINDKISRAKKKLDENRVGY